MVDLPPSDQFIDGEWRSARSQAIARPIVNPTDESIITEVVDGSVDDVDAAVRAAQEALHGPWGSAPPSERSRALRAVSAALVEHRDRLARLESLNVGKLLASSLDDVEFAAACFAYSASLALQLDGRRYSDPLLVADIRREPVGVVGVITPFNFPLAIASTKIAGALAAGCTVVHKPSENTPLTALLLAELLAGAGLPAGVYNLVLGDGETVGASIVEHPGTDKIAFTGSTSAGIQVLAAAARQVKRASVELGGKSANIVFADADLDEAIQIAHDAYVFNSGQCCDAGTRLLVEEPVYDDVVAGLAERARSARLGDPFAAETDLGPLIDADARSRVEEYVREALEEGALVTAGAELPDCGFFAAPTVVSAIDNRARIAQEEIFGPVLVVIPFDSEDDAVRLANASPYGLAAGVQTGSVDRVYRLASRLRVGTVYVNNWGNGNPEIPFGGVKASGFGREHGPEGLAEYLEVKSVVTSVR
jgi:acyl-CoA reductase-like NAD-dependent aldehyde dehydrogenase